MKGKILVALKRYDRVEDFLPYLEQLAESGSRVSFLIPYPVNLWLYLRDLWVTTESRTHAMQEGRDILERYSWESQRRLADQEVLPVREALEKNGVEVSVHLYSGTLKAAVAHYTATADVRWILLPEPRKAPMAGMLRGMTSLFGLFKPSGLYPLLLIRLCESGLSDDQTGR